MQQSWSAFTRLFFDICGLPICRIASRCTGLADWCTEARSRCTGLPDL